MKPPVFSYHDPVTIAETVALLGRLENAKLLAGGQSLMPMLNMRYVLPDHVIDLNRVADLAYIREEAGTLDVGAMTRQRDLEFSPLVRRLCPLMSEAILHVGHRQTRNRGTLGGSLSHLDPAAELVTVAAALDATVDVVGPGGERSVAFADFPAGYMTPAMEPDEILVRVSFPCWPTGHGWGFEELARRHGDFAVVSAAAMLVEDDDGRIVRAALVIGGAGPAPVRMVGIEQGLVGQIATADLFRASCEACRSIDAIGDVHAPAQYRQQVAAVMGRRALQKAHERAAGGRNTGR
jgi:carbon-monoxide dehydrogenase medium subunit